MVFEDRADAGRQLAKALESLRGQDVIVLGLPRGGVVVAYEVAKHLGAPMDVIITHKVPAPGNAEYAIGAVAEVGEAQINEAEVGALGIPRRYVDREIDAEMQEIDRRKQEYRGGRPLPSLKNKVVIVVDDGVATGYTMLAALRAAKAQGPRRLIAAVPVGPADTIDALRRIADDVVALQAPANFFAVGMFYRHFEQTTDREVVKLLTDARGGGPLSTSQ